MRQLATRLCGTIALGLITAAPVVARDHTIEDLEADPNFTEVESRTLAGLCAPMEPLAKTIKAKDAVKVIVEIDCDHVTFNIGDGNRLMAFYNSKSRQGVFFQGTWDDGTFNISSISFDQKTRHPVSKGRVSIFETPDGLMFVAFAVFEDDVTKGVAFRLED